MVNSPIQSDTRLCCVPALRGQEDPHGYKLHSPRTVCYMTIQILVTTTLTWTVENFFFFSQQIHHSICVTAMWQSILVCLPALFTLSNAREEKPWINDIKHVVSFGDSFTDQSRAHSISNGTYPGRYYKTIYPPDDPSAEGRVSWPWYVYTRYKFTLG
jgi:hypothetical protein